MMQGASVRVVLYKEVKLPLATAIVGISTKDICVIVVVDPDDLPVRNYSPLKFMWLIYGDAKCLHRWVESIMIFEYEPVLGEAYSGDVHRYLLKC